MSLDHVSALAGEEIGKTMGTRMEKPLSEISLTELTSLCLSEMSKYRRKEPNNDQYCMEVFRRALVLQDNEAWIVLRELFGENVRLWLGRHPQREIALRHQTERDYTDDTFTRFWRAMIDQKLNFTSLASILSYLHLCLNCAVMDTLRTYSRPREEAIPELGHAHEPRVEDEYNEGELWESIENLLTGEKERRVAYLHFHCNLKPREIIRYCPGEFSSENEIYRIKRNVLERIMRNVDKLRWRLRDHE